MPSDPTRPTALVRRAGCAAEHPPGFLLPLLGLPPSVDDPNASVGNSTAADDAMYRLSDDTALVLTADVFIPIVDGPRDFGRVTAADAPSDVYAMGGLRLAALSVAGFPEALPVGVIGVFLTGAAVAAGTRSRPLSRFSGWRWSERSFRTIF